ncbi:hypothetical protein MYSTI_03056 [Myxococcus stipitatus DSM 14675]|uniref:ADP-ribosylation/crystallin J1 n=1 Tax=Myxococcus stipitatus (strain DSM 14675 / JCM 12634 / Mx s8) TaxID=1278073 RepID=L7U9Z7_MYXSD|nr:hypothetical protein [Myxococcus stipitatus]AGC44372.1 hypothetical protein MYSTI_03056 [Myxococcus stipitatus DSM 14675]
MILFRPVGLEELLLISRTGMRRFPPRLPDQPIFYPVLNRGYAEQIARDWNTKSGTLAGYVTEFEVEDSHARSFEVQQVGGREHLELWVPAESLDVFNDHIQGTIRVLGAFFGASFAGVAPSESALKGLNARDQFEALRALVSQEPGALQREVAVNHEAVFAHLFFWEQLGEESVSAREKAAALAAIRAAWSAVFPEMPLGA